MRRLMLLSWLLLFFVAACKDETPPTATSDPLPRLQVTVTEALVFERPSRDAAVLFRLIEGDQTVILAQTEPDDLGTRWYQIGQGDRFGWIVESQVQVSGDLNQVREVALAVTLTPIPTSTEIPINTPTPRPGVAAFATINEAEIPVFVSPSANAAQSYTLLQGESVDIIGRTAPDSTGDSYFFVAQEGFPMGWVLATQVTTFGDLTTVPTVMDAFATALPTEAAQMTTPTLPVSATFTTQPLLTPTTTVQATHAPQSFTPTPSSTADLASTVQSAPTATDFPTETPVPAAVGIRRGNPPPLSITLPAGWEAAHVLVPISSFALAGDLPVSLYRGPLNNEVTGSIWLIWGFPNIAAATGEINLYSDGVQLLRSVVLDPDVCTIGLGDEKRQYFIGGYEATGTIYAASPCSDFSDIAGFFAVLQVGGGNYAFFVGVEPVDKVSSGLREIQVILDSIVFEE